ncbi:MAG: 30S ribosomal protein S9 [Candidatus Methylacidiphilales bacterium]
MADKPLFAATGRRKTATAHANLIPGSGSIKVNGKPLNAYFVTDSQCATVLKPLLVTETNKKFDVQLRTEGGGLVGQAGASSLAIAKALVQSDAEFKPKLRENGLLTRDPRSRERKKSGQPGARKRFQFSKR